MGRRENGLSGVLLLVGILILVTVSAGVYLYSSGELGGVFSTGDEDAASDADSDASDGDSDDEEPTPTETYGWGEVLLEVEREPDGINVYFANEGRVGFADLVLRCVNKYRKDFDSVACYGFPSAEAFQTAEVDPETGGIEKKCWQAYYSVSGRGKDERESGGAIDNGQAGDLGCPIT